MTGYPGSPPLIKAALVLIDPVTNQVTSVAALQYNPDKLTRTIQLHAVSEGTDRLEALRLKAPIETIKLQAIIDAADFLEQPEQNPAAVEHGIGPQLSALEMILYPSVARIEEVNSKAAQGILEIAPAESPLIVFVFGRDLVAPVRITEYSVTEEEFDPRLNPIRATVSMTLRVLSSVDLPPTHRGAAIYLAYQRQRELLRTMLPNATLGQTGINSL